MLRGSAPRFSRISPSEPNGCHGCRARPVPPARPLHQLLEAAVHVKPPECIPLLSMGHLMHNSMHITACVKWVMLRSDSLKTRRQCQPACCWAPWLLLLGMLPDNHFATAALSGVSSKHSTGSGTSTFFLSLPLPPLQKFSTALDTGVLFVF